MPTEKEFLAKKAELDLKQDKLTAGDNITINSSTNVISATDTTYSDVTGATSQTAGTHGLVPAPAAGDESKFLKGDGTWDTVSAGSASLAGLTDVDLNNPTDGQALVYDATNQEWVNGEAGNTDYVELTQAEYNALTPEEQMNGTLYFITDGEGGGGSGGDGDTNVYGAFIDTNRVIQAETSVGSSDTYTATQDCMVVILLPIGNHNTYVYIDGVKVINMSGMPNTYYDYTTIPLKKGQVMTFDFGSTSGYIAVYGLTFGTQNIFTPQIFSLEERCIGVWIDNKPLYQKSIAFDNTSSTNLSIDVRTLSIDTLAYKRIWVKNTGYQVNTYFNTSEDQVHSYYDETGYIHIRRGTAFAGNGYITIQYTKTTDVAGSGSYNTLGVPMVHYSTDEQVVGTAEDENGIIKPLYEKMTYISSLPNATETEYSLGITNIRKVYYVKCIAETSTIVLPLFYNAGNDNQSKIQMFVSDKLSGKIKINTFGDNRSGMSGTVIIRYTKTTD